MPHIPHNRNANFLLLLNISCCVWSVKCGLVPLTQVLELLSLAGISNVQSGSQGVHVEEGILPVLNVGDWVPVERLVTGVAHSWQIHPSALLFDLDTLEPKLLVNHLFLGSTYSASWNSPASC